MPIRVAVVDDYELVVAGIAAVLAPFPERITVVELDSGLPVVADVDVVLYDTFGQPQGDQMDLDGLLRGQAARLLVISWNTDMRLVREAREAGAAGYVSKAVTALELVEAIERVHAGQEVTPTASDRDQFGRWPGDHLGLSAREAEVLALICQGFSNQQVGERAFIGINTVKTHIRTLYRKIGVASRAQAVIWGLEHGFEPDRVRHLDDSR